MSQNKVFILLPDTKIFNHPAEKNLMKISGGLSLALGLSEVKCKRHYYRDLSGDQLGLGYPDFNTLGSGGLSGYGMGLGGSGLGGHTNLGFSSDNLSVYGSKPGLYMTPHTEEDR